MWNNIRRETKLESVDDLVQIFLSLEQRVSIRHALANHMGTVLVASAECGEGGAWSRYAQLIACCCRVDWAVSTENGESEGSQRAGPPDTNTQGRETAQPRTHPVTPTVPERFACITTP